MCGCMCVCVCARACAWSAHPPLSLCTCADVYTHHSRFSRDLFLHENLFFHQYFLLDPNNWARHFNDAERRERKEGTRVGGEIERSRDQRSRDREGRGEGTVRMSYRLRKRQWRCTISTLARAPKPTHTHVRAHTQTHAHANFCRTASGWCQRQPAAGACNPLGAIALALEKSL